jgi:hypothetical protein
LVSIALRPAPLVQVPEVPLEFLPVLLLVHAVDADRRVLANTAERPHERLLIDEVCQ